MSVGGRVDDVLRAKLDDLLGNVTEQRDLVAKYIVTGTFSYFQALSYMLQSPDPILHLHVLNCLSNTEWPSMSQPAARPFYQGFASAAYSLMTNLVNNTNFSGDATAHEVLSLLYQYYPPSRRVHKWVDEATWYLVIRCTLLAFGIGAVSHNSSSAALNLNVRSQLIRASRNFLRSLFDAGLEPLVISSVKWLLNEWDLDIAVTIYSQVTLDVLDRGVAEKLLSATLTVLYDRFYFEPGIALHETLETFLQELKTSHLHVFYAPLISMMPTQNPRGACRLWMWLRVLSSAVSGPSLFLAELDLIAVVLFSSMGPRKPYALGQVVFLSHVALAVRHLRQGGEPHHPDHLHALKLLVDLERHLAMLLNARTRLNQPGLHPVLKHLVVVILSEIRQCALPRKRPSWLGVALSWSEAMLAADLTFIQGEMSSIDRLVTLKLAQPHRPSRLPNVIQRSGDFSPLPTADIPLDSDVTIVPSSAASLFSAHQQPPILSLLVAVYFHITDDELIALLPLVWQHGLNRVDVCPQAQLLLLLAAERIGPHVDSMVQARLTAPFAFSLVQPLEIASSFFEARRSILRHLAVVDPSERPFRRIGPNLAFVSMTVGTFEPVLQESRWLEKLKLAGTPLDEIKMIQSLGWDADDDEDTGELLSDHQRLRNRPVTLCSSVFEEIFVAESQGCFPTPPPRKKPLLTPLMGTILLDLTHQLYTAADPQLAFRNELLLSVMRDEPSWFLRLLLTGLDKLQGEELSLRLTHVSHLISLRPKLPLQFAYHAFNYLAGWLKHIFREQGFTDLRVAAMAVPIMARILPSSHEVTFRELRKAKLDAAFICDARLLLQEPSSFFRIPHSRFISSLKETGGIIPHIPQALLDIGLLRIGQSLFTTRLLQKTPHDALPLARTLTGFEPISWFFNQKDELIPSDTFKKGTFCAFSALHSHAWLSFLEGLFNHLDWNYQDRNGLQVLLEGVNRIILSHVGDFSLVARAVRLLVRVAQQFRRLFNIKSGYSLFINALFNAYFITQNRLLRDGIRYAIALFFNLHQESFVFQMLGSLVPLMLDQQASQMSQALYEWFLCLEQTPINDAFNLLDTIATVPKPVLPQDEDRGLGSFLASHAKPLHHESSIADFKHFSVADSLRLFITIIAYDPGSLRSEQFVVTLQHLLPFLMKSISASELVDFAIKSIIPVFVRFSKKGSLFNRLMHQTPDDELEPRDVASHYNQDWPQNDRIQIRIEFFKLLGVLLQLGGDLLPPQYDSILFILRNVVKVNTPAHAPLETFIQKIILPTQDLSLRADLGFKALVSLETILGSLTRPAAVADVLSGVALLASALVGKSYEFSQFDGLFHNYLKFGCQAFSTMPPEGAHLVGPSLGSLFCIVIQILPRVALQELQGLPSTTTCLGYFIVPFCASLPLDDSFFERSQHGLSQKTIAQHMWALLLGTVSSPLVASLAASSRLQPDEHPLAASLNFLLGLVGLKLIMTRAHHILFMEIPSTIYQTAQLLQTYVFDPLLVSPSRSHVPSPVRSHAAWKLITYFESSCHNTFYPLFFKTIHQLRKFSKPPMESTTSSNHNVSLIVPASIQHSQGQDAPEPNMSESNPSRRRLTFRFSRRSTKTKADPTKSSDPNCIWEGISINHVLTQLENHTFYLQACPQPIRLCSSSNSVSHGSGLSSPLLSPPQEVLHYMGDSLAVPTSSPSRRSFSSTAPSVQVVPSSPHSFTEELTFFLVTFGFPLPSHNI
ncbi:hypothetical protein DSO57_1019455 [Entomophthora muscae]|uniref:Uncharacterized protein n=1 Tax=Entomophthora muscae TaxID=34485 RepID=A0ACC2TR53_9FUNG|nr:hypothetical protein DSO57_1019455 [Entomophthora muscae]